MCVGCGLTGRIGEVEVIQGKNEGVVDEAVGIGWPGWTKHLSYLCFSVPSEVD